MSYSSIFLVLVPINYANSKMNYFFHSQQDTLKVPPAVHKARNSRLICVLMRTEPEIFFLLCPEAIRSRRKVARLSLPHRPPSLGDSQTENPTRPFSFDGQAVYQEIRLDERKRGTGWRRDIESLKIFLPQSTSVDGAGRKGNGVLKCKFVCGSCCTLVRGNLTLFFLLLQLLLLLLHLYHKGRNR